MVHGSWGDHHNWDLVAPRLAETHTVLTYDRRGHSQSQRLTSQGSVHDDVADLAALIEQAGIAPAHVVGNSFGASICLRLAAERPELIRSLIVHEPPLVGLIAEDPAMASILQVFGERIGGVVETLLDEGTYLVSERTMYRILEAADEVRERRAQLRHPTYHKPELLATGPNQTWSWDITRLLGPAKWTYFYLYVILDIYSRYVVGWMIAHRESTELARRLIADTIANQGIAPGTLVLHADRGSSMKSKPVALLLADLGVTKSHSRPHVNNDNPYSESQFRTLKYWPSFPERFGCAQDAREFCRRFFPWYNDDHRHSGVGYLTPAIVHSGGAQAAHAARTITLQLAYAAHPERFVRGLPHPPHLPTEGLDQQAVPKPGGTSVISRPKLSQVVSGATTQVVSGA